MLARGLLLAVLLVGCRRDRTLVLVSNEDSGDVTVIDAERDEVVRTIPVGKRPRGMRVSPDGRLLYVALSGSTKGGPPGTREEAKPARDDAADGIGVVDLVKGKLLRVIASGRDPEAFDLSADGKRLYVANEETAELSVVELPDGNVSKRIPVGGEPEGVSLSPDGSAVYVTSEEDAIVSVIDARTDAVVATVPVGKRPRAIAFAKDRAFVTAEGSGKVSVIDTRSRTRVGDIALGGGARPMGIVTTADRAFVSNGREGSVSFLDLDRRSVLRAIGAVGTRPWGLGLLPDGKKLYVAAGNDVAVVDAGIGEVVRRIPAGKGPWGIAIAKAPR